MLSHGDNVADRFWLIVEGSSEHPCEPGVARRNPFGVVAQKQTLGISDNISNVSNGNTAFVPPLKYNVMQPTSCELNTLKCRHPI
jgi:hypothetical protein